MRGIGPRSDRTLPPSDRILSYFIPEPNSGCWLWSAYLSPSGYGRINWVSRSTNQAHRVVYEIFVGAIPEGLTLDHLCRVRSCVNPEHLEAVPLSVNTLRGENHVAKNARATQCPYGHPYDEGNTYHRPDGDGRGCLTCIRARGRKHRNDEQEA